MRADVRIALVGHPGLWADPRFVDAGIDEMVRRIVERFHPERIILFGSHARGTADPDSDVDLLVVMPVSGSKRQQAIDIDVALADILLPKDIIVLTPQELESDRDVVNTIGHAALREGRLLYERSP